MKPMFAFLACALIAAMAHADPTGVYSTLATGAPVPATLLSNPDISGVVLRNTWPTVETTPGSYDFSYFDAEMSKLQAAGKQAVLVINSGGQSSPSWLFGMGAVPFSFINNNVNQDNYGETITIPVFWDETLRIRKKLLIEAMGAHFGSHPAIAAVNVQCANSNTADWNVPATLADIANWKRLGFTSDKLLDACKEFVAATLDAFPGKPAVMAIGRISASLDTYGDADYVARSLITYEAVANPGRFIAARYNLSATTPNPALTSQLGAWQVLYDARPGIAAQTLWAATDTSSCRQNGSISPCPPATVMTKTVATAKAYGVKWLEAYQADVNNPDLSAIIRDANINLH